MPINYRFDPLKHYTATSSGCWEWNGSKNDRGYGQIRRGGHAAMAHRYFFEHLIGPIPDGMVLDHLCRNTSCVNPKHLEIVTNTENKIRGVGFSGINARKETCPRGHVLADVYTVHGKSRRRCKECKKERDAIYRLKTRHPERYAALAKESGR